MQDGLGDGDFAFPADGKSVERRVEHRKQLQSRDSLFQPGALFGTVETTEGGDEVKERFDGHRRMAEVLDS